MDNMWLKTVTQIVKHLPAQSKIDKPPIVIEGPKHYASPPVNTVWMAPFCKLRT